MPQALVKTLGDASYLYYRHTLPVRVMHWINVVALTILLMSGLQIFNAYPELHWGKASSTGPQAQRRGVSRVRDIQSTPGA